jgi:hypothetical protein
VEIPGSFPGNDANSFNGKLLKIPGSGFRLSSEISGLSITIIEIGAVPLQYTKKIFDSSKKYLMVVRV